MPTLEQIDLVIREYHIVNILLFIIGWMMYDLYKLYKNSKPSEKQLNITKSNINKANKLIADKKIFLDNDKAKQRLLEDNLLTIIKDYDKKYKILQDNYSELSAKMNISLKKISNLEFEKKFLQDKIDNLVEELMRRQSYDNVKKHKPTRAYYYPFSIYDNNEGIKP